MPAFPVQPRLPRWHLVCRVIDNFGDVGVMWRLARQLHDEHGVQVDFFIDQPECLRLMAPGIRVIGEHDAAVPAAGAFPPGMPGRQRSMPSRTPVAEEGIRVHRLDEAAMAGMDVDVIVAGFQARLPEAARRGLLTHAVPTPAAPLLIQLDYLSAEGWIDDTHGLPSLHPDGLREWFFNPGFGRHNGGLLIERDLLARRDAFLASPARRDEWLHRHGVQARSGEYLISVLAYPTAPLRRLLEGWLRTARHGGDAETSCHAARECRPLPRQGGKALAAEAPMRPKLHLLIPGATTQPHLMAEARAVAAQSNGRLRVSALPFLPQPAFDALLWCCDINLVRGEDSWIRALWAGKPWLWHAYPQAEETHLEKLDAFVARVRALMSSVPSSGGESPVSPGKGRPDTPNGPGDPADLHTLIDHWHAALRAWNGAAGANAEALCSWLQAALPGPAPSGGHEMTADTPCTPVSLATRMPEATRQPAATWFGLSGATTSGPVTPATFGRLMAGRVHAEAGDLCSRLVAFASSKLDEQG